MTHMAPVSRGKANEKSFAKTPGFSLNQPDDFMNSVVLLRGTAKRKQSQTEENPDVNNARKKKLEENFSKLRPPPVKTHHKRAHTVERVMTKSCEVLLECIKPYKEIVLSRRTQVTESTRTIRSILKKDVMYERTATRKVVQHLRFSEAARFPVCKQKPASSQDSTLFEFPEKADPDTDPLEVNRNGTGRTVSSEDFINRVLTDPESVFL